MSEDKQNIDINNVSTCNMTIDIKQLILRLLRNSDASYKDWLGSHTGHGFVKEMNANNQAIKAILESIK